MQELPVSPLAQKLADSHDVDLTEVGAANPEGTITARNVLDFLNLTADEEATMKRRDDRKAAAKVLDQTKAQLQSTALVHQKALMQVGALKHENEALDNEVERLRSKEMINKAFIKELEQKKLELERELEKSKKRPARFAWLRKRVF